MDSKLKVNNARVPCYPCPSHLRHVATVPVKVVLACVVKCSGRRPGLMAWLPGANLGPAMPTACTRLHQHTTTCGLYVRATPWRASGNIRYDRAQPVQESTSTTERPNPAPTRLHLSGVADLKPNTTEQDRGSNCACTCTSSTHACATLAHQPACYLLAAGTSGAGCGALS